jgi:electron transfer flavoprotein alpha subunit
MKALLVCEYRNGKLLDTSYELVVFAGKLGAAPLLLLIGSEEEVPEVNGTVYLAEARKYGEYNPDLHKRLVMAVAEREQPDCIVFLHSAYGWDLAPRVAVALRAGQISEVTAVVDGEFETGICNDKLRRIVSPKTATAVITVRAGAFNAASIIRGTPRLERIGIEGAASGLKFVCYEPAETREVDLTRADVVVSVGRGIGKKENVPVIASLADALGGVMGASRPATDAGWVEQSRQVGITGQIVSPRLYIACGISGAVQHLAGLRNPEFVVAINKDKDAPIGEVADVLVVADVMQFVPALTTRLQQPGPP